MADSAANVAGSVTVQIGGSLAPLQAALAQAEQMTRAFDAKMASATSGAGVSANLSKVNATIAETAAALDKVTAPAAAAVAQIDKIAVSSMGSAVSASAMAKALEMTGGNLSKITPEMLGMAAANDAAAASTIALTEASAAATVGMSALGAAEAEAAGMGAGVTREFMVLGSEVLRGNFSRIPSSLIVMNERLVTTGTSVLTMGNAMKALGALGSVVFNPYVLGFLAITVGLDLAVKGFEKLSHGTDDATEALQRQKLLVDQLTAAYPAMGKSLKSALDISSLETPNQFLITSLAEIKNAQKTVAQLTQELNSSVAGITAGGGRSGATNGLAYFPALTAQLREFVSEFDAGNISAKTLQDDIAGLELNPSLTDGTRALIQSFADVATKISVADADAKAFSSTIAALQAQGGMIIGGDFSQLGGGFADAMKQFQSVIDSGVSPKDKLTQAYKKNLGGATDLSEIQGFTNAYKQAMAVLDQKAANSAGAKGASAFDTTTNSILKQIAALQSEATTYGMSTAAVEAAKIQQQLLTAAQQDHVALSPKLLAQINAQAQAYGKAAQAAKLAQLANNDNTARSMLGLNSTDQNIAGQFGNDWATQMNGPIAQSMRLTAALADLKQGAEDAGNTFLSTFVSDLKNGTPVIQSFADAAIAAFDQVAQKLEQMAIDNLVSNAFGGLTGGSSGGFNILSLFGLGGSSAFSGSVASAFGHAGGGLISGPGTGTSDSVNARLSNGEFVVKAAAVPANLPSLVAMNKGYADGGLVGSNNNSPRFANSNSPQKMQITVGASVDGNGTIMPYVKSVLVDGIEQFSASVLPGRLQQIAQDGRARG